MNDSTADSELAKKISILLLKTKSFPHDGYERYFAAPDVETRGWAFQPIFVPVLEHRFLDEALTIVTCLLKEKQISSGESARYGGLIFTSQRAVEAFAKVVEERRGCSENHNEELNGWPYLQNVPVYTVGPATFRALSSIPQAPPLTIFGSETGNGEALAHLMFKHYGDWYADRSPKPPLLFLVGEQRRDIIPKTLMDPALPKDKQIYVDELAIYGTRVMETFDDDFSRILKETEGNKVRWVVVFSPTGCEGMLRALDMLDARTGRVKSGELGGGGCGNRKGKGKRTYIATIGPTTRDYLRKTFGFEADVCAEKPSPEGIGEAIQKFMLKNCEG